MGHLVYETLGHKGIGPVLDRAPRINGHRQPGDEEFDVEVRNLVEDSVPIRGIRVIDKSPQAHDVDPILYRLRSDIFHDRTGNRLVIPPYQLTLAVKAGLNPLARG